MAQVPRLIFAVLAAVIIAFGYMQLTSPGPVERGELLYGTYCVSCHGVKGVGERPDDIYARDEFGFVAPPMDDSGHAWHHTDEQLVSMILDGSPRNERMKAWKADLSEEDAMDLVVYIKSLWSPFIRENCQGPMHMDIKCMIREYWI